MPINDWIDAETRVERARQLYEKGRWVEAAAELRAAIDVHPDNADWHFNLALTFDAMEEYPRAIESYQTAMSLAPDDLETLNCLGVDLTRLGRYAEALEFFGRIQKIDPTYEASYCNRIITYMEMGDHDNAEVMFYLARQVKPECPLCFYNIGLSFHARRLFDRAIGCWKQALALDSRHPDAHHRIAEALWEKGNLAEAAGHYQHELDNDPADVDALLDMGELQIEMGRLNEATEKFRRVLEQSPDHATAHFCLGEIAIKQDKLTRAEEQFRLVLRIAPDYPAAHARLGQLLLRTGRTKHAAKHLLAELQRCGDNADMMQELGQLLIEAGHVYRANSVLKRVVRVRPDDAVAHHNLAVSFFMLDQYEDGIRHCRRALKLRKDYPLALFNLALAHFQIGQKSRARRYVGLAMLRSPGDPQLAQLSRRLGMDGLWPRAKEWFKGVRFFRRR
jgi:tetratricopeptide (TPR) repeat protein